MRPMTMQGTLQMTWSGRQVPLTGGEIVIGRGTDCDVELLALTVSDRHCRILVEAKSRTVEIEDLNSVGGTLVNGERVKRCRLKDGDQADAGGFLFRVRLSGSARLGPTVAAGRTARRRCGPAAASSAAGRTGRGC